MMFGRKSRIYCQQTFVNLPVTTMMASEASTTSIVQLRWFDENAEVSTITFDMERLRTAPKKQRCRMSSLS